MIYLLGEVMLAILDPAGRAGGDKGQHAAVAYPLKQLVCLLHDGEVGGEIGVKDLVEAEPAKGCDHLAGHVGAYLVAERLAQSDSDRGSGVDYDILIGIRNGLKDLGGVVLLIESAYGAVDYALTAGDAGILVKRQLKRGADVSVESSGVCADNADSLIVAGGDAAAAEDALAVIPYHVGSGVVILECGVFACEGVLIGHAVVAAELLKLAVAAAYAGEAFLPVGG